MKRNSLIIILTILCIYSFIATIFAFDNISRENFLEEKAQEAIEKHNEMAKEYNVLLNNSRLMADKCDEELNYLRNQCNEKISSANERTLEAREERDECVDSYNELAEEFDDDRTYTLEEKMEDLTGLIKAVSPFSIFN